MLKIKILTVKLELQFDFLFGSASETRAVKRGRLHGDVLNPFLAQDSVADLIGP